MEFTYQRPSAKTQATGTAVMLVTYGALFPIFVFDAGAQSLGSLKLAVFILMACALAGLTVAALLESRRTRLSLDPAGIVIRYPFSWLKPDLMLPWDTLTAVEHSPQDRLVYLETRNDIYEIGLDEWQARSVASTSPADALLTGLQQYFPGLTHTQRFDSAQYRKRFLPTIPLLPMVMLTTVIALAAQQAAQIVMLPDNSLFNYFVAGATLTVVLLGLLGLHLRVPDARYTVNNGVQVSFVLGFLCLLTLGKGLPRYLLTHGQTETHVYTLQTTDHRTQVWRPDTPDLPTQTIYRHRGEDFRHDQPGSLHIIVIHRGFLDLRVIDQADLDALKKSAD